MADLNNSPCEAVHVLAARTTEIMHKHQVKAHLMELWMTVRKFVPVPLRAGMSPKQHLIAQLENVIAQLENYLRAVAMYVESEKEWERAAVSCITGHAIVCKCLDATWEPHPVLMHWLHQEPNKDKAKLQALMDVVTAHQMLPSAALSLEEVANFI